jgi:glycosyltransferase involved in cell wall biosynthesis
MDKHMSAAPPVSVAIISYQQKPYIGKALQSVVDQDYQNLQIVVSDDHSTDGTADEIARYAKRYPDRVVALLNQERVGLTANSNRALRRCTGKYVCLLGGDDLFLPGKLRRQVAWFEESPKRVLCGHQVELFFEDGTPSFDYPRPLTSGKGAADLIRRGPYAACSTMVRSRNLPAGGFDEKIALVSDFLMWVEVLAQGGEFGFVPGTYARYRRHNSNVSADIEAMALDTERALELIERRYPQYAKECRIARARRVDYALGVQFLKNGNRKAARNAFMRTIRLDPTFAKAWVRAIQTIARV